MTRFLENPFAWRREYLDRANAEMHKPRQDRGSKTTTPPTSRATSTKDRASSRPRASQDKATNTTAATASTNGTAKAKTSDLTAFDLLDAVCLILDGVPPSSMPIPVSELHRRLWEYLTEAPSRRSEARLASQLAVVLKDLPFTCPPGTVYRRPPNQVDPDLSL